MNTERDTEIDGLVNMYAEDAHLYGSASAGARLRAEAQERRVEQLNASADWFRRNGLESDGFVGEIANARALAESYRRDAEILTAAGK